MKTSTFISTITFAFLMLISMDANAQKFPELDKSPMDAASFPNDDKDANKVIKIIYSRPQLKGRDLEQLVPRGEVWRTGANEAAELTLYQNMAFGDNKLEAGTYTFYLLPNRGDKKWIGIISSQLNVWGSYFYKEHYDVARFSVEPTFKNGNSIEAFSITFDKKDESTNVIHMNLAWGETRLAFPFTPN